MKHLKTKQKMVIFLTSMTVFLVFYTLVSNALQILPPSGSTKTFQFSELGHQRFTGEEMSAGFLDD